MNLLSLRYFCEVAQCGNVTEASRRLYVSQPAVSRSIRSLESELKTELFRHTSLGMELTENGRIFYEKASAALKLLDEGRRMVSPPSSPDSRLLRLFTYVRFDFLPELLLEFQKAHPDISLEIHYASYDTELKDSEYDIAIIPDSYLSLDQESVVLLEDEFILAVPRTNPLSEREAIDLSEAKDFPFVAMRAGFPTRKCLDESCRKAMFQPVISVECDDLATYSHFVRSGYGLALISSLSWFKSSEHVRFIHLSNPRCSRLICLAWPSSKPVSEVRDIFSVYLLEQIKKYI